VRSVDAGFIGALEAWFLRSARALPWRATTRDPWATLVSELMLQQTQAGRVAERFPGFLARFPTAIELARASEDEVLAAWSGLGYYRRAGHLHRAARLIVERFGGVTPTDPNLLRSLPGVGRYTAGAVASIAGGLAEPAVDGNIARVLLRLDGRALRHGSPSALKWAWERAAALARVAGARAGIVNEALMELGATVCTPRAPRCDRCPLAARCQARRTGRQERIPLPRRATSRRTLRCAAAIVTRDGRVLVERRPDRGLFAGLWQAPTLEGRAAVSDLARHAGAADLRRVASFVHRTTHLDLRFVVYRGRWGCRAGVNGRRWVGERDLTSLPLASPQRRILELAFASPAPAR
jgi:A/G-specific adenine glycosylase